MVLPPCGQVHLETPVERTEVRVLLVLLEISSAVATKVPLGGRERPETAAGP